MNFRTLASLPLAVFILALSAPAAHAQELKTVYAPELAGGEVFVEGIVHVRFVGNARTPVTPGPLVTAWQTFFGRKLRRVIVSERRFAGQPEDEWKAEHVYLVAKVAAVFPPIVKAITWNTAELQPKTATPAPAPAIAPPALLAPKQRVRFPRRFSALDRPMLQPFELPQPFTLFPHPRPQSPRAG